MSRLSAGLALIFAAAASLAACTTMPAPVSGGSGQTVTGTYLEGNLAAAEGDLNSAAAFYADTLRQDPDNNDLLTRTFLYAATVGDTERAILLASRITAQQPDNRAARLVLAVAAMAKKNYSAALDNIHKASQGPFTSLTNSVLEAWALEGQGNTEGALKALDALQSQSGVQGLYAFHKALILDSAGRTKDAEAAYKESLSLTGAGPRVADAYGRFMEIHGNTTGARELYARLEKENPSHPVAQEARARLAAGAKPKPMIETPAEGAAEGLFGIAASLTEDRSADVAMFYLNLTLYLRPDLDLARVLLADHYEQQEKYDIANAIYGKIGTSSPYHGMIEVQKAINEARQSHTGKAVAELQAMGQREPNNVDVWTALGDIYRSAEKYPEASAAYDKAVAAAGTSDERLWNLYYARGVSEERSKHWDNAERDLKESLKLKPDQPQVLNYLGYSWVDQGRNLKEAVGMLEKARALRPLDGYIVDSVGWAYFRLSRFKDAATTLEQAVLLTPGDPTVNDHLGDAYWRVGRKNEARFQWSHALALEPTADRKLIIEKKLEQGLDAAGNGGAS